MTKYSRKFLQLIEGNDNNEINAYHTARHNNANFPAYTGWEQVWYGDVWQGVMADGTGLSERLNLVDESRDDSNWLLRKIERAAMKKHFDELVPFYELAVLEGEGITLYEKICSAFIDQLAHLTSDSEAFVLLAHSMGCAVSYNVMSHISAESKGENYCLIDGTLSDEYRQKVSEFVASGKECFGLMTFGNYTGYNWCQRLNNRLLNGRYEKEYAYPNSVGRWFNFWTILGGDPYILDDKLDETIVSDENDGYDDVSVWRRPGKNIGHGRAHWFRRKQFSRKLKLKMAKHLYSI